MTTDFCNTSYQLVCVSFLLLSSGNGTGHLIYYCIIDLITLILKGTEYLNKCTQFSFKGTNMWDEKPTVLI